MMASRMFQSIILQMKDAVDRTIGIINASGAVVACTDLKRIGEMREDAAAELSYVGDMIRFGGYTYRPVADRTTRFEYAVFVHGEDENARSICSMATIAISNIKTLYDEKHDKATFVKNIILDNILPGDIYIKSRELHFESDIPRAVFLIRQEERADVAALDVIQGLFPDKQRDFVLHINESDIVLVKEVKAATEDKELYKIAKGIEDTLENEIQIKCIIGIGTVCNQLKDVAKSFKEAQTALEIGVVFDNEQNIVNYDTLGLARLIYQLPTTLCEMFLNEIFKKGSIDALDQETLFTIQKFFENNLNVSETSRKLFVHRNTLVYRLEKIKKLTGLDLREFDHAIVFKVALMVRKYLASREGGRIQS